jgi:chromate transporter
MAGQADLLDGIALGQTMPGPLAAQVAMWVGYLRRGTLGALATAAAFVMPSFLLVIAIAFFYVRFQGLPFVQSVFYGVSPAVIAIIVLAAVKLARLTDGKDPRLWVISATVMIVTAVTGRRLPSFPGCGCWHAVVGRPPEVDSLASHANALGSAHPEHRPGPCRR